MKFSTFNAAVQKQFKKMTDTGMLYRSSVTGDELWATYLASFPAGSDPVYRTRTEHDCSCCRNFIRTVGNVVAFDSNGGMLTIWDETVKGEPEYDIVSKAMAAMVRTGSVLDKFVHYENHAGTAKSFEKVTDGVKEWDHFYVTIPAAFVKKKDTIPTFLGQERTRKEVFARALETIAMDAVETFLELESQNSIYQGSTHKAIVVEFRKQKVAYDKSKTKEAFVWANVGSFAAPIRNSVIGTLLIDLSEGVELDRAVASFEQKVAPTNYKRPTALVTPKMVEQAKKTLADLNLLTALERRYANVTDITVNNLLYVDSKTKAVIEGDVFDELASSVKKPKTDKLEEVALDKFLTDILPRAKTVEIMMENRHQNNLVSLITAVDPTAEHLFKWSNPFSWSYRGEVTDSIKERVKAAGGNVTGELCCRLAWEYTDDLDFYMYEPGGGYIYFGNRSSTSRNGGRLDVDANGGSGMMDHPVENIFYNRVSTMKDGTYTLKVKNYYRRSSGTKGFEVEIDLLGDVHHFTYDKVVPQSGEVEVAHVVKKGSSIEVKPVLPSSRSGGNSKEFWGIATNQFTKVAAVMHSPNHWDNEGVGNKHVMFMLEGCVSDEPARGFYNEFLKESLNVHRKVMEMVGAKMKVTDTPNQLSGLGFSVTKRDSFVVKVGGASTRMLKIVV